MSDDLVELERMAGSLLRGLSVSEQRNLMRRMARELAARQRRRIAAQTNPDGSPFAARKRAGRIRQRAMFRRLRNGRYLRSGVDDAGLWVGFSGTASRIARVHQYGLRDKPSLRAKAVAYPKRELLGVTAADSERLLEMMLAQLAEP